MMQPTRPKSDCTSNIHNGRRAPVIFAVACGLVLVMVVVYLLVRETRHPEAARSAARGTPEEDESVSLTEAAARRKPESERTVKALEAMKSTTPVPADLAREWAQRKGVVRLSAEIAGNHSPTQPATVYITRGPLAIHIWFERTTDHDLPLSHSAWAAALTAWVWRDIDGDTPISCVPQVVSLHRSLPPYDPLPGTGSLALADASLIWCFLLIDLPPSHHAAGNHVLKVELDFSKLVGEALGEASTATTKYELRDVTTADDRFAVLESAIELAKSARKVDEVEALARQMLQQRAFSYAAHAELAWVAWQRGDLVGAVSLKERAVMCLEKELDPETASMSRATRDHAIGAMRSWIRQRQMELDARKK